ncbi:hypothetical protein FsymDg_0303 [Candidatus Protofrankia datiscae]|uniref:Uncharacterized protein n=1 Tax=Candidatus Protofrankia datiscae TaxID=2716812 RepID=F8B3N5_9ACTN|nr:hypothetical protein FsymDg_0303 [Candidatus Protofrankia datiscae]
MVARPAGPAVLRGVASLSVTDTINITAGLRLRHHLPRLPHYHPE